MANDLDELMDRDPLDLSDADINRIIEYQRASRARRAAGEKVVRPSTAPTLDIDALTKKLKPAVKEADKIRRI